MLIPIHHFNMKMPVWLMTFRKKMCHSCVYVTSNACVNYMTLLYKLYALLDQYKLYHFTGIHSHAAHI